MKLQLVLFLLFACVSHGTERTTAPNAIKGVLKLLGDLKASIEKEGKAQQEDFDKYACWCEKKLAETAKQISSATKLIETTQVQINQNTGAGASLQAEVEQLQKQLAENSAEQRDANAVRENEFSTYQNERLEFENTIGALEAAIKVFSGGKKSAFLDATNRQTQLLSVTGQIRKALTLEQSAWHSTEEPENVEILRSFVTDPVSFLSQSRDGLSAMQVGQNPFGDYAPKSTQIQGILKSMYDSFTADLEKINVDEAESQKSHEELMATKQAEKKTLAATLLKQQTSAAATVKKISQLKLLRDNTEEQNAADKEFFADTKDACKQRAAEWALRSRLRTEELNGMATAIKILSSSSAKDAFKSSHETFLQLSSVQSHQGRSRMHSLKAYRRLMTMAAESHSVRMVRLAAAVKSGGHFDGIIASIDQMVAELRKEEQNDISRRDMCENQQNANKNELEDLDAAIAKASFSLKQMSNTKAELEDDIDQLKKDISASKKDLKELMDFRAKEEADFQKSQKDDADARGLILQARDALLKFYKDNAAFVQDPPSRKSETTNIVSMLDMLAEDIAKEMAEAKADDTDAKEQFEKQKATLEKALDAQEETKASTEEELADLEEKMSERRRYKKGKNDDKSAELDTKKALDASCKWVKTHFKSRKEKRKDEVDGLTEAKNYLAGVDAGEDPLPVD